MGRSEVSAKITVVAVDAGAARTRSRIMPGADRGAGNTRYF